MKTITYKSEFIEIPHLKFVALVNELDWIRVGSTPRMEYYCNEVEADYTYGKGNGIRTYTRMPWSKTLLEIKKNAEEELGVSFEVAFLNRYLNSKDHLGWHADDSPEVDPERPIAIISLGAEREIWFKENNSTDVKTLKLANGSLCVMKPGMQSTHIHRIPKANYDAGPRISVTLRGYKK